MVAGVGPSPPSPVLAFNFCVIAHRVQQSPCLSIFYRVFLTRALGLSASYFMHKKSPQAFVRTYESALGEIRTHETDLYHARGQPDTPPGRPADLAVILVPGRIAGSYDTTNS